MTECARSAVTQDGEISKYVDVLQGAAQGCTLSSNLFKIVSIYLYIIYVSRVVAVEAARQGATMGEDAVSGIDVCG